MAEPKEQKKSDNLIPWDQIDGAHPLPPWREPTRQHQRVIIDFRELDAEIAALPEEKQSEETPLGMPPLSETPMVDLQERYWDVFVQRTPETEQAFQSSLSAAFAHLTTPEARARTSYTLDLEIFTGFLHLAVEIGGPTDPFDTTGYLERLILDPQNDQGSRDEIICWFCLNPNDVLFVAKMALGYTQRQKARLWKSDEKITEEAKKLFGVFTAAFHKVRDQIPLLIDSHFGALALLFQKYSAHPSLALRDIELGQKTPWNSPYWVIEATEEELRESKSI